MPQNDNLKRFNNLFCEMDSVYHEINAKLGVSDSAAIILYELCIKESECTFSEIIERTGLSKQTLSSSIQKLESDGIVRLTLKNGRSKNVALTDYGKSFTLKNVCKVIKAENQALEAWTDEEFDIFYTLFERFRKSMKDFADKIEKKKS